MRQDVNNEGWRVDLLCSLCEQSENRLHGHCKVSEKQKLQWTKVVDVGMLHQYMGDMHNVYDNFTTTATSTSTFTIRAISFTIYLV